MASIEEMIKSSTCFGLAFSPTVRECKICEVRLRCENKCKMGSEEAPKKPAPVVMADKDEVSLSEDAVEKTKAKEAQADGAEGNESQQEEPTRKKRRRSKKEKNSNVEYSSDMPNFRAMSIEEVGQLLEERGGNFADFDKYENPSIKKMRLVMAVKKTYELK